MGGVYSVAPESKEAKARRFSRIIDALDCAMPEAKIALDYADDVQLLASVMLSAQTTDVAVNKATPALFARFKSAADYAHAGEGQIAPYIRSLGLFRNKARNLAAAMAAIADRHGGRVPRTRAELEALPGVGPKTAGVVLIHLGAEHAFPVDTHIRRLSYRMGLTRNRDPDHIEVDLRALLAQERWGRGHQLLIWHGRRVCRARDPSCDRCIVAGLCPQKGVPSAALRH
jgi:endonuclease-3